MLVETGVLVDKTVDSVELDAFGSSAVVIGAVAFAHDDMLAPLAGPVVPVAGTTAAVADAAVAAVAVHKTGGMFAATDESLSKGSCHHSSGNGRLSLSPFHSSFLYSSTSAALVVSWTE